MHPPLVTVSYKYNSRNREHANYNVPKVIGFLSLDANRQCSIDAGQLKYINVNVLLQQRVKFDLNLGAEKTIYKDDIIDEKLSNLLRFLSVQEKHLNLPLPSSIDESWFFCNRGLLTALSITPYEHNEPWRIVATLFKGDIYLCKIHTEKYLNDVKNMSERHRKATSWGHKFEHFLSSLSPRNEPNPDEVLNQNEEFNVIFQIKINNHNLVFGAEMDGVILQENTEPIADTNFESVVNYLKSLEFIELKTNSHLDTRNQQNTYHRFKTMKWWAQNYIVGVDKILCGYRDDNGVVDKLKLHTLSDLKRDARDWDPIVCKNFLAAFLSYVKKCLKSEIEMKYGENQDLLKLPVISLHFESYPRAHVVSVTNNYNYESDPILPENFVKSYGNYRTEFNKYK